METRELVAGIVIIIAFCICICFSVNKVCNTYLKTREMELQESRLQSLDKFLHPQPELPNFTSGEAL